MDLLGGRAGVWPRRSSVCAFFCVLGGRTAGSEAEIASGGSAGAAGQRVAEAGRPSFQLQRPPMPPLLLRRRMLVMCDSSYHHLGRGRPWPALIDGHDIHSQQGRDAAGEAWLRSHLRAKCPGSRVLHKPVSRSVGTYAVATIRGSSGSSRDSALDEPTRTPRRCARARACRRF